MRLTGGGYTIIEVMIFLAVSGVLLVAAIVAIGGQQGHTEFNTAVNDVNTKFQQWIDQVTNGFSGSTATATASRFNCSIGSSGYPVLTPVSSGGNTRGANPDCIFLGKAIQINDGTSTNSNQIYAYSIIADRQDPNPSNPGALAADLVTAHPTTAVSSTPGSPLDLTETYTIPNGARVKWVRSGPTAISITTPGSGTSHLAGFYTSFNSGGSSTSQNGSQSLLGVQYPFTSNVPARDITVINCIRMNTTTCSPTLGLSLTNPWPMNQWVVCLQSTRNSDTAAINIVSTNGHGATTKVTVPCPGS